MDPFWKKINAQITVDPESRPFDSLNRASRDQVLLSALLSPDPEARGFVRQRLLDRYAPHVEDITTVDKITQENLVEVMKLLLLNGAPQKAVELVVLTRDILNMFDEKALEGHAKHSLLSVLGYFFDRADMVGEDEKLILLQDISEALAQKWEDVSPFDIKMQIATRWLQNQINIKRNAALIFSWDKELAPLLFWRLLNNDNKILDFDKMSLLQDYASYHDVNDILEGHFSILRDSLSTSYKTDPTAKEFASITMSNIFTHGTENWDILEKLMTLPWKSNEVNPSFMDKVAQMAQTQKILRANPSWLKDNCPNLDLSLQRYKMSKEFGNHHPPAPPKIM